MGRYKKIIRWILALCCLAYIVHFFVKNTEELTLILKLHPLSVIGMVCFVFLGHAIYCFRFRIVLEKCSERSMPLWSWFKIFMLGRFLGTLAPQAGNIYRSIYLKQNYQISYTRYASSLFSFFWLDTCFNMIYALIIVLVIKPNLQIGRFSALNFLIIFSSCLILMPLFLTFVFRSVKFRHRYLSWLQQKTSELLTVTVTSVKDGVYILKIMLTGLIAFINVIILFHICFLSFDISVSLPTLALFYVILKLSTQIIITPGNIGVREIAYGILSEQMGVGMAEGIIVSAVIRILSTCIIIVFGVLFGGIDLLGHRKDYSKLEE